MGKQIRYNTTMKVKKGSEDEFQLRVANYLDKHHYVWFHTPNGGKRHIAVATKMKAMGVKRGVPDVMIFDPVKIDGFSYTGMALELKSFTGVTSRDQVKWKAFLIKRGWYHNFLWSMAEFDELMDRVERVSL